ncbi:uncharacterized protein EI97DRAFT_495421 [Westerdykella ornata]|uniref:HD domain-containing protein n=1 Tax=Westerdykella ornata TaxID=318751 RepID=A0A6A6JDU8_WESOR|nr:uncharacterized protein EI97DRAFT_495421 [Westerdykella ornata]KAF2274445.1 hypothetical protein EI97DRAFT_495421 [Westerdykella ornata]
MVVFLPLATRVIAGVTVPNTALINSSIELARQNLPSHGFGHVMRSWLNGQALVNRLPQPERAKFDEEAFGVSAILHDMGWAFNTSFVSNDKIFEVDGANAARDLIRKKGGRGWDQHRIQLVWDAIALHTSRDIAPYKQREVAYLSMGIYLELVGVEIAKQRYGELITVPEAEWDRIAAEFPRPGMKGYFSGVMIGLCVLKPEMTYANFVGDWGEKYVQGYTRVGHRVIDLLEAVLPE